MGKKPLWKHFGFDYCDKEVEVMGPKDFRMMVDYDDVNHSQVEKITEKMIDILNKHWND